MEKEQWKDIPEYEGMYQVSNLGNIKSLSREVCNSKRCFISKEKILKLSKDSGNYSIVHLYIKGSKRSTKKVHQLVAECFLNHKPCGYNLVINHKDFNRLNNNIENLEIVNTRENTNKKHLKSSSKYTGVSWHKNRNKWQSQILINGKIKHLGYFINELEASEAYQLKLKTYE